MCSPGLKTLCQSEILESGLSGDKLEMIQGGIEFNARLTDCMQLNLHLRSASRILMRISRFKADSFEKLEKKLQAIDWILYLPKNANLKFNVTARKSRLYHSDAIAQRCERIIVNQLGSVSGDKPDKKTSPQTLYIRAENDAFTLSLDSTGDLLFKRGIKQNVGKAPLRENLAFAMLAWAKFSTQDILIDPMCGSGTFSLEAAMMTTLVPPGFFRSFAFEAWPGFSHKTYAFQKHQAKEKFLSFTRKQIFASDVDEMALAAMKENLSHHAFTHIIDLAGKDFFSIDPSRISPGKKGVIMLNPPYGKRLEENKDARNFYREIGKKLTADFKGWRIGIVLPSRADHACLDLKLELKPIFHGGLDVFAGIGII